jgi:hypothetical protein
MRVDWGGKWLDARTQIRGIFQDMLRIEDAADGRLPPQGAPDGVSKQALNDVHPSARLSAQKLTNLKKWEFMEIPRTYRFR